MKLLRLFALPALAALTLGLPVSAVPDSAPDPWEAALALDVPTALPQFEEAVENAGPEDNTSRLALASALLLKQPRISSNFERALRLCEAVIARPDASRDDAVLARYLANRIRHVHLTPPDLSRVRAGYEELLRDYPEHPLANQAAVKLVIMDLYEDPPADLATARARANELLQVTTDADARREIHYILGREAWLNLQDGPLALRHLIAARELDFQTLDRNSDVDIAIAGIAREIGRPEIALTHYQRFLEDKKRDSRVTTVRQIVDELRTQIGEDAP